jgi:hypothetical protein
MDASNAEIRFLLLTEESLSKGQGRCEQYERKSGKENKSVLAPSRYDINHQGYSVDSPWDDAE